MTAFRPMHVCEPSNTDRQNRVEVRHHLLQEFPTKISRHNIFFLVMNVLSISAHGHDMFTFEARNSHTWLK